MLELNKKYVDESGNTVILTAINKNTVIAGTDEKSITYSLNGKAGYRMLENSLYAKSLKEATTPGGNNMENVTIGYATTEAREALKAANLEKNKALVVSKGMKLKVTQVNDAVINGQHAYDYITNYEVLAVRKGKDGRRVQVKNLDYGYVVVFLIDLSVSTVEVQ